MAWIVQARRSIAAFLGIFSPAFNAQGKTLQGTLVALGVWCWLVADLTCGFGGRGTVLRRHYAVVMVGVGGDGWCVQAFLTNGAIGADSELG